MGNVRDEIVQNPKERVAYSSYNQGWFGYFRNNEFMWENCRDRFHVYIESYGVKNFFFVSGGKSLSERVFDFIEDVENISGVCEKDKTWFSKTAKDEIIYVYMSDWWRYRVRRSLFTAFLRAGVFYENRDGDNLVKAIKSVQWLRETYPAVSLFLSGRTAVKIKKNADFTGWYNKFHGLSEDLCRNILVKPSKMTEVE